jgi:hypothetical protein
VVLAALMLLFMVSGGAVSVSCQHRMAISTTSSISFWRCSYIKKRCGGAAVGVTMDYSIFLWDSYCEEKANSGSSDAMENAIVNTGVPYRKLATRWRIYRAGLYDVHARV